MPWLAELRLAIKAVVGEQEGGSLKPDRLTATFDAEPTVSSRACKLLTFITNKFYFRYTVDHNNPTTPLQQLGVAGELRTKDDPAIAAAAST